MNALRWIRGDATRGDYYAVMFSIFVLTIFIPVVLAFF